MKHAQREVYLELSNEVDATLCSWCKYCEISCCEGQECHSPILKERDKGIEPGDDCWAFKLKPNMPISLIADIVGIVLGNGWHEWIWRDKLDESPIKVYGR